MPIVFVILSFNMYFQFLGAVRSASCGVPPPCPGTAPSFADFLRAEILQVIQATTMAAPFVYILSAYMVDLMKQS